MKIGYIQYNPRFGAVDENINRAAVFIRSVSADILVLPELSTTGYLITSLDEIEELAEEIPGGKTTEALAGLARERSCFIVAGLAERSGGNLYNSAVLVGPEGYIAHYRKLHLFYEEKRWFTPGDKEFSVYDLGIAKVGIMVCFDWYFPESMRILALKGAHLVCHPSNLVLPFCQDAMKIRCLENRVYAVTANRTGSEMRGGKRFDYTGMSQITAPGGEILHRAERDKDAAIVVDVDIKKAENKAVNRYNDLFADRRPEFYGLITKEYRF